MQQIIYWSRPFGYDTATLAGILSTARIKNAQLNITGALLCRSDIYLQLLEGPVGQVETIYNKIERDDRHVDVKLLVRSKIVDRLFGQWAMYHDPAATWAFTKQEVADGALGRASARDIRQIFLRMAQACDL